MIFPTHNFINGCAEKKMPFCFPKVSFSLLKSLWEQYGVIRVFQVLPTSSVGTPGTWLGKINLKLYYSPFICSSSLLYSKSKQLIFSLVQPWLALHLPTPSPFFHPIPNSQVICLLRGLMSQNPKKKSLSAVQ